MKTCFSEGKLMKQFGNPPLSKRTPFQLTPLFLSNFFMTPLFVQISKTRNPPNFRGEETLSNNSDDGDNDLIIMEIGWLR